MEKANFFEKKNYSLKLFPNIKYAICENLVG